MQKLAGLKEDLRNSLLDSSSLTSDKMKEKENVEDEANEESREEEYEGSSDESESQTESERADADAEDADDYYESDLANSEEEEESSCSSSDEDHQQLMNEQSYDDNLAEEFVNIEDYDVIKQDRNQLLAVNKVCKKRFSINNFFNEFVFFYNS